MVEGRQAERREAQAKVPCRPKLEESGAKLGNSKALKLVATSVPRFKCNFECKKCNGHEYRQEVMGMDVGNIGRGACAARAASHQVPACRLTIEILLLASIHQPITAASAIITITR